MDLISSMNVSASGMSAQRTRMNVVSSNLANINTTRTPEGGPYVRKNVILSAVPVRDSFGKLFEENISAPNVAAITNDQSEFQKVYDPSHPDADASGYVLMPNVNLMKEMVDMLSATRAYEANSTVISTIKGMAQRAIDIGNK
jgi:flagellar basal-body rod protein FlgC